MWLRGVGVVGQGDGVFLRRHRKRVDRIDYDYWTLCQSVRTAAGPRQQVVASMGKLTAPEETQWRRAGMRRGVRVGASLDPSREIRRLSRAS